MPTDMQPKEMVKVIVMLRAGIESPQLDERYNDFLMKFEALPGLRRKAVSNVWGAPGGVMPFGVIIEGYFDSREALREALTSEAGVEAGNLLLEFGGADAATLFADVQEEDGTIIEARQRADDAE